jgi:hypothetical protein
MSLRRSESNHDAVGFETSPSSAFWERMNSSLLLKASMVK